MRKKEKLIGIYAIENIVSNKAYVGSSINVIFRMQKHKSQLRHNKHVNSYLQNAWNKHGEHNFKFSILEECDREELTAREQDWVNVLGEYNITKEVMRNTPSKASRLKMSITRKAKIASGEIQKNNTKKIMKYSKNGEFMKEYSTITSASKENDISTDQIRRVLKQIHRTAGGFQWKYSTSDINIYPYAGRDYTEGHKKLQRKMEVLDIDTGILYEFESYKKCGEFFGVSSQTVSRASKNTRNLYKNRFQIRTL